jgi:hypothetical protein
MCVPVIMIHYIARSRIYTAETAVHPAAIDSVFRHHICGQNKQTPVWCRLLGIVPWRVKHNTVRNMNWQCGCCVFVRIFHLLHYSTAEYGLRDLSYQMVGWEFHLGSNLFSEAQNYIIILIKILSYETSIFHSRQGPEIFLLCSTSRPVLRPTQPPIQ